MTKKTNTSKITFSIPEKGNLGILALGAKGVLAWRKSKKAKNEKNAQ